MTGQQVPRPWRASGALLAGLAASLASGCTTPGPASPIAWWHNLEGGAIAAQRPPPPGATDPYPHIGSVPPRPPPVDPTLAPRIGSVLELDRVTAAQQAADNPLTPPAATPPQAVAAPAAPGTASATVAAAEAPAPPAPPAARPVPTPPAQADAAAPLPVVPPAPPPPPVLTGLAIPIPPPPAPPAPPPAGPLHLAESVIVPFPLGSADLPPQASASLRALAARRHGAPVAVVTHGEAPATADPLAQQQALALSLRRAQAMADTLVGAGVPVSAVHIDAQAIGRGGAARLLD